MAYYYVSISWVPFSKNVRNQVDPSNGNAGMGSPGVKASFVACMVDLQVKTSQTKLKEERFLLVSVSTIYYCRKIMSKGIGKICC